MKQILFGILLSCSIFVLGCDKLEDVSIEEVSFDDYENEFAEKNYNNDITSNALKIGMEQYEAGDFSAAIDTYTKAINQDSKNVNLYTDRGRAKRDSGDLDGAIEDVDKALELSQEGWIYAERAVAYNMKGEKELALNDYKKALKLDPNIDWIKQSIQELETK